MKKILSIITVLLVILLVSCGGDKNTTETVILNGGFESGPTETWEGWTRVKSAFSPLGVVNDDTSNGVEVEKTGEYWYSGLAGGTQRMTGELVSNEFKLTGLGYITFKMGAAKYDDIHVDFYVVGNDEPVASITNYDFNEPWITVQLVRKIVDLREYLNETMYIKVVDNDDDDDFGYVNLDDFVIIEDEAQLTLHQNERNSQLERFAEPLFEEDETSTTIVNGGFETGDLTGWKLLSGSAFSNANIVSTDQLYWDVSKVYGWGDYYLDGSNNGETPESAVGKIRSTKFTLAGDGYISFMIGGSPNLAYVAINDGETDEELIKVYNETFKDPSMTLTLRRVYVDASEFMGKVLYISIVDEKSSGGFAFITADDFRVSLTEDDVKDLMLEQYNAIMEETHDSDYNNLAAIRKYYQEYDYPFELPVLKIDSYVKNKILPISESIDLTEFLSEASASFGSVNVELSLTKVVLGETTYETNFDNFDLTEVATYEVFYEATYNDETVTASFFIQIASSLDITNGGFELGDLTGWEVISGNVDVDNAVLKADTFWGENISYNKTGQYHFDGWSANDVEVEGYQLKSSNFTLSGTGYITFRMGGNAAFLKVYEAETDKLVAYYTNTEFADINFPYVGEGSRLATMTKYVADLSEHISKELYIVIGDDEDVSGWAVAFFDDIVAYHEVKPELGFDEVNESADKADELVEIAHKEAINVLLINGGFEMGNLYGWTLLDGDIDLDEAISSDKNFWGEKISFNSTGEYHFNGWTSGALEPEGYSLRSSNFYLRGSGFISFKLGGNAAYVKVYKASDNELVGHYINNKFADINFPLLGEGSRLATMTTFFADLSEYLGEELYLVFGDDENVSGWAVAFVDDIITYYKDEPTLSYDEVEESNETGEIVEIDHEIAVNLVS